MKPLHYAFILTLTGAVGLTWYRSRPASAASDLREAATVQSILAEYYGARWEGIRAGLSPSQASILDIPVDADSLPSWEDTEPKLKEEVLATILQGRTDRIRQICGDDTSVDLTYARLNPTGKSLSADQLGELSGTHTSFQLQMEPLAAHAFELTYLADQQVRDTRQYELTLFVTPNAETPPRESANLLVMRQFARNGWIVSYLIDSVSWPELDQVMKELTELKYRRDLELASRIAQF